MSMDFLFEHLFLMSLITNEKRRSFNWRYEYLKYEDTKKNIK